MQPETTDTEFEFVLPKGLIDEQGTVHQRGTMRLATAKDELAVHKNRQVQADPDYGVLVILSRVITRLGTCSIVTPEMLENLFSRDLAYLREFYNRINQQGDALIPVQCPHCNSHFKAELALAGEF